MTIGTYETIRQLGSGGMSDVYEVANAHLGSRHALKLFTKAENDDESRERFLAEGRLLAKLAHPRIVKVTDFGVDAASGRPYFVMDLVLTADEEKKSLDEVEPGSVDEEMIGRWYDDLRDGLAYIHGKGVVHRDLKLQNVLIGPDGHAVLTDFGISRIFDPNGDGNRIIDTVQTIVRMREGRNLVMGSIGYMAPELEMGVVATPASDWYALGVIVYRLLTGTWCDARTDVVSTLETYDPVWRRIIPKLLHANPQGRECLSYAEEKAADRERFEAEAEERWLSEKRRGHVARHVARWASVLALGLAVSLGVVLMRAPAAAPVAPAANDPASAANANEARARLMEPGENALDFDNLFRIPSVEELAEGLTEDERDLLPTRTELEAARVDAIVLTHDLFVSLRQGALTPETLARRLTEMREKLDEGSLVSPFDALGGADWTYTQVGNDEALSLLLDRATRRLEELCAP